MSSSQPEAQWVLVDSECNLAESVDGRLAQQYISSKLEEVEYQIRKFPRK